MGLIQKAGGAVSSGAKSVGGAVSKGFKDVGATLGALNPLKKGPTYGGGQVDDALKVKSPTMDPNARAATVQGAPTEVGGPDAVGEVASHTGAQIEAVADPRAVLMDPSMQAQFRQQQQDNISRLALQAQGQGPSLATEMLTQNQRAGQAATFAQMASTRGGANPMAARSAMMAASQSQGQLGRDAASARIQEQMAAQQQLAGALGEARQQDIGMALEQARLEQERNLATYRGQLERAIQQGQLDQQTANAMYDQANTNARLAFEQKSISAREAFGQMNQNARQNAQMAGEFQRLQAEYARMGMSAEQANQMAALQVNEMRNNEAFRSFQSKAAADAAQKAAVGNFLSQAAQIGATAAFGPAGGMAAGAIGKTAAGAPIAADGSAWSNTSAGGQRSQVMYPTSDYGTVLSGPPAPKR